MLAPAMQGWWNFVASKVPDCHLSDTWRDELTQNEYFRLKKSMRRWPDSLHNKMKDGKPAALAWDCFRINSKGGAEFPNPAHDRFYPRIFALLESAGAPIEWAGNWKGRFKESVHFELAQT